VFGPSGLSAPVKAPTGPPLHRQPLRKQDASDGPAVRQTQDYKGAIKPINLATIFDSEAGRLEKLGHTALGNVAQSVFALAVSIPADFWSVIPGDERRAVAHVPKALTIAFNGVAVYSDEACTNQDCQQKLVSFWIRVDEAIRQRLADGLLLLSHRRATPNQVQNPFSF